GSFVEQSRAIKQSKKGNRKEEYDKSVELRELMKAAEAYREIMNYDLSDKTAFDEIVEAIGDIATDPDQITKRLPFVGGASDIQENRELNRIQEKQKAGEKLTSREEAILISSQAQASEESH